MQKQGTVFWKCWNAKLGKDKSGIVDGVSNATTIVSHFAEYFSKVCIVCTNSTLPGSERLKSAYSYSRHILWSYDR